MSIENNYEYNSNVSDESGPCGVRYANICLELMPAADRDEIGMI